MSMTDRVSTLYLIIDLQADLIDEYKKIIDLSHKKDELDVLRIQPMENKVRALRDKVGAP